MIRRPAPLLRLGPLALAALCACQSPPAVDPATAPPPGPAPVAASSPPTPANAAASRPPPLLEEQRRLAALFDGTPVVFAMQAGGSLKVEIPARFCFEPGQVAVKPALAAVLDRVAQSQRDATSRIQLGAAGDAATKPRSAASAAARNGAAPRVALASRRAASVRDRLVAQGIASERLTVVDNDFAGVRLLVTASPAP